MPTRQKAPAVAMPAAGVIFYLAMALTALSSAWPTYAADDLSIEADTNRPGEDYRSFDIDPGDVFFPQTAGVDVCRAACAAEDVCRAYTYVKPGLQGQFAKCWLKKSAPAARPHQCCVSGEKTDSAATSRPLPRGEVKRQFDRLPELVVEPAGRDPGPLGRGEAEGAVNGKSKSALPVCPAFGMPKPVEQVIKLLQRVGESFGAKTTLDSRCGTYKREIAAGVDLKPPASLDRAPLWPGLGGSGELTARSLLCLAKDLGEAPGAHHELVASAPLGVTTRQSFGLTSFDPVAKTAQLFHLVRMCAPLIGCIDAQRQTIDLALRRSEPAWPGAYRLGDYRIASSSSLEVAAPWSTIALGARLPDIMINTPYGQVKINPEFTFESGLYPIDTPFGGATEAKHNIAVDRRGTRSVVLQDTYGRAAPPLILRALTNTTPPKAPASLSPQLVWTDPQTAFARGGRGWSSQIAFGGRQGEEWNGSGARPDFSLTRPRAPLETSPSARFDVAAPFRYTPPNPIALLPAGVRKLVGKFEFWIDVRPSYVGTYGAQLALVAREAGALNNFCRENVPCDVSETALLAQATAHASAGLTGNLHLLIEISLPTTIPIRYKIEVDQPFAVKIVDGGSFDPSPALNGVADVRARAAATVHVADEAQGDWRISQGRGWSGKTWSDLNAWTEQCMATTRPAEVWTPPPPKHEPGSAEDLVPDLLPCNICVADDHDKGLGYFRIHDVGAVAPGVERGACRNTQHLGCLDMCSWNKAAARFSRVERSAIDVVGLRCRAGLR